MDRTTSCTFVADYNYTWCCYSTINYGPERY